MLKDLVMAMKSKYGDEVILNMVDESQNIEFIPTGILGVDYVIGRPGIPAKKITQITGFEDTGKSLLSQIILISFQKYSEFCIPVLLDTEYAFDQNFFASLGGDPDNMVVATPKTLEKCFQFMEDFVEEVQRRYKKQYHILFVIDSLSLAAESEIESGAYQPGLHARFLSHVFRKIKTQLPRWNATLIYVSQNKEKISMTPWGGGTARLGGHAVDFAPVLTLEMKKISVREDSEGNARFIEFKVRAMKNHIAVPFREIEIVFDLREMKFRDGFNLLQFLTRSGKIKKNKGWCEYNGKKYREREMFDILEKDENLINEIRKALNIAYEDYQMLKVGG